MKCDKHVKVFVKGVVDRVVVADCFERRFGSSVFFGNVVEIRVYDANLFDDLGIVVKTNTCDPSL